MRQAFDSLPMEKQGEAVRLIVAARGLAYQDFPVNLKKEMSRLFIVSGDDLDGHL